MRCGPAYGLDGQMNLSSRSQNRVLLDALPTGLSGGLEVVEDPDLPVIDLHLEQQFSSGGSTTTGPNARVRTTISL